MIVHMLPAFKRWQDPKDRKQPFFVFSLLMSTYNSLGYINFSAEPWSGNLILKILYLKSPSDAEVDNDCISGVIS